MDIEVTHDNNSKSTSPVNLELWNQGLDGLRLSMSWRPVPVRDKDGPLAGMDQEPFSLSTFRLSQACHLLSRGGLNIGSNATPTPAIVAVTPGYTCVALDAHLTDGLVQPSLIQAQHERQRREKA